MYVVHCIMIIRMHQCHIAYQLHTTQDAANTDATVVAVVDDITIMETLAAVVSVEQSCDLLQKLATTW